MKEWGPDGLRKRGESTRRAQSGLSCLQSSNNLIRMAVDFDFTKDRLDDAGAIDDKRTAFDPPIFLPVHILEFVGPVGFGNGGVFIAEQ